MAKAYGVYNAGPIDNPNDLGRAIQRAIEVVKRGEPALARRSSICSFRIRNYRPHEVVPCATRTEPVPF